MRTPYATLLLLVLVCACRSTTGDAVNYELEFTGATAIGERTLRRAIVDNLADFERTGKKSAIDDAAYTVQSVYRSAGYPFAIADYEVRPLDGGRQLARILVEEGPRTRLAFVDFRGNEVLADEELVTLIGGPTSLLGSVTYFVQSEVDSARSAIENRYVERGNLLVEVSAPRVEFSADRTSAEVTYVISEGPTFQVAAIRLLGAETLSHEDLLAALSVTEGERYVPDVERRLRAGLVEYLGQNGYTDAEVTLRRTLDRESGEVSLLLDVDEGDRILVTGVRIEGNERTRDSLIRRRLDVVVGEPFTPARERRSFRRLFSTGLFSRIRLDLEGEEAERELVVSLDETPSREVFVEPGWGSYELARAKVGYRNLNLFGTGRSFRAESIAAIRHQELEIGLSDPFLFGGNVFADASARILQRAEPSFRRVAAGIDLTLTRAWTSTFRTGISYELERSKARDVDITDPAALAALQDVDISSFELSARYDSRDSPLVPSKGHTLRGALQWADSTIGSELDFVRFSYSQGHFFSILQGTVLALSLRTGVIVPTHDTQEIPLQERYFNGGESTVRSFRQDELGPLDVNKEPLGGEGFTVLNAELRQRLVGNLSAAMFWDAGNVVVEYEDYTDFTDFETAVGMGIRYLLPIGPLRLDGAWNPDPRGGQDDFLIHFSVGMAF